MKLRIIGFIALLSIVGWPAAAQQAVDEELERLSRALVHSYGRLEQARNDTAKTCATC